MDRWYGADELRESWCILVLVAAQADEQSYATGWAIGDGNAEQLLNMDQKREGGRTAESAVLQSLSEELDARRYQDTILITGAQQTLRFLRSRFLTNETFSQPTLRGYRHLALDGILDEYVDVGAAGGSLPQLQSQPLQQTEVEAGQVSLQSAVEDVWQLRTQLGPLVPAAALEGQRT